jgi:hypothetical protein
MCYIDGMFNTRKWAVEHALVATVFALIVAIFSIPLAVGVMVGSWAFCADFLLTKNKRKNKD